MKIKQLINYDRMKEFMNAPIEWFYQFGDAYQTADGIMIFKNNDSPILGVAHLDNVNEQDHFYVNKFAGDDIVFSTSLDDRLGAYIILEILPQLDIHADILLTEGEEKGRSTAKYFTTTKQYNWMYSFDRKGVDVVHYRYTMTKWLDALKIVWGQNYFRGSNSDIDYLFALECCGVNVGTGYHNEHDLMAFANMTETSKQIGRFCQFYHTNKRTHYTYVAPPPAKYTPPPATNVPHYPTYSGYNAYSGYNTQVVDYGEDDIDDGRKEFNPYEGMSTDVPFDIETYTGDNGIIDVPVECAFCCEGLKPQDLHVFMGICKYCEQWAVECQVCGEYYCRMDTPSEDMGEELYFGICPVCAREARITNNANETNRLQDPSTGRPELDAPDTGDESPVEGGHPGAGHGCDQRNCGGCDGVCNCKSGGNCKDATDLP